MRRVTLFAASVLASVVAASAAQAAQDISIFLYPPGQGSSGRPLVSPIPRETVEYAGPYKPGTIVVNTSERRLYYVLPDHEALKYGVGVGRPGFAWAGASHVVNKREWPD